MPLMATQQTGPEHPPPQYAKNALEQARHYIFECKSTRPYVSRPSRTQMLENPKVLAKLKAEGKPSVEVPEEFKNKTGTANKILALKEKEREKEAHAKDMESSSRKRAQIPAHPPDRSRTSALGQIRPRVQESEIENGVYLVVEAAVLDRGHAHVQCPPTIRIIRWRCGCSFFQAETEMWK
ncbi:hypothetical protein H0H93_015995 [Arthromyces matolae]|nr:hypothetical protein H0H93_015995 [Arthromyces matolae]